MWQEQCQENRDMSGSTYVALLYTMSIIQFTPLSDLQGPINQNGEWSQEVI